MFQRAIARIQRGLGEFFKGELGQGFDSDLPAWSSIIAAPLKVA
jgi:hypothetical protein